MQVETVSFLACGWALPSATRHGTAIALHDGTRTILVDCGGDVARGLVATHTLESLSDIYLTHEHPDHTWALPGLLHALRFAGSREGLTIHGPRPALERCQRAIEALGVTVPFELTWCALEVSPGEDENARWRPAEHSVPVLSYRFGDVVVCGDTAPCKATVELARGASLLVHEATHTDEERTHAAGHATPADAGRIATESDVDTLALIHRHPALSAEEACQASGFDPVVSPQDGDQLHRSDASWQHVRHGRNDTNGGP